MSDSFYFRNGPPMSVWQVETRLFDRLRDIGLVVAVSAVEAMDIAEQCSRERNRYDTSLQGTIWIAKVTYIGPVATVVGKPNLET